MADKQFAAPTWPWPPAVPSLRLPSALVLILVITFATWCCDRSIDAGEKDEQKPATAQETATPWQTAAPLNKGPDLVFESAPPTLTRDTATLSPGPNRNSSAAASGSKESARSPMANQAPIKPLNYVDIARYLIIETAKPNLTRNAADLSPTPPSITSLAADGLKETPRSSLSNASSGKVSDVDELARERAFEIAQTTPEQGSAEPLPGPRPSWSGAAGGLKDPPQSPTASPTPARAFNADEIARDMQLRDLRKQEQQLLTIFGEAHPDVVAVRRQMAILLGSESVRAPEPAKNVRPKPSPPPTPAGPIPSPKQERQSVQPTAAPAVVVHQDAKPAAPAQQPQVAPIITLPPPRVVAPADVLQAPMQPPVENPVAPLGSTPQPTAKELAKFAEYVQGFGDPTNTLDLIKGRNRLMLLKATPKKIQTSDESIVSPAVFGDKQVTLLGKTVGTTVLNLWFESVDDKKTDVVLSYLVRVFPDPDEKKHLEAKYKALEVEINRTFFDSVIHLQLVGDKVVVTGQALDIHDATQILKIIVANTPGSAAGGAAKPGSKDAPAGAVQNTPRPEQPDAAGGATPGQENYLASGSPNVINMIRIPGVQQVKLKVVVAEVNRTAARSIGLNFSIANNQGIQVVQNQTGSLVTPFGFGANGLSGTLGNAATAGLSGVSPLANVPVALSNGQVILAINALKSMHYAKSLAEPSLTASNGHTATFSAGGQFPVPVVTGNTYNGLAGVQYVPYGVQLNFTPFITDKDRIRLNVSATVSTRDTTTGTTVGNSTVPGLTARNFTSTIDLREGQTLAVAGLLQTNLGTDRDQLPFLGEIPFINRFTGFDRTSAGEQELVVLITPELVQPMKKGSEIPRLPGSDLFEPSDLEFYLLGRLEGRRTTDFRSPVMTDYHRIQQYNRCEQTYIFGPSGYATPAKLAK